MSKEWTSGGAWAEAPGEYLIALHNTANGVKAVRHVVVHDNLAVTTPVQHDGTQPNVYLGAHMKVKGWMPLPAFPSAKKGPPQMDSTEKAFYQGIEHFAAWLLDNKEGTVVMEELLRPWAVQAWKEHVAATNGKKIK